VYTAAEQIEAAGGRALPVAGDIRDEAQVEQAVAQAVERFGGIDVCVNNASAINLSGTEALEIKRYDLMQSINTRGTFVVSRACPPAPRAGNRNPMPCLPDCPGGRHSGVKGACGVAARALRAPCDPGRRPRDLAAIKAMGPARHVPAPPAQTVPNR
jgi:NAD(P)-dependent dehydrogenase (short-subunit alcohol dehydrogenase family)